jgi:hypothetical protein
MMLRCRQVFRQQNRVFNFGSSVHTVSKFNAIADILFSNGIFSIIAAFEGAAPSPGALHSMK